MHRFFPFYTFNLLAGFDENGRGQVINYDAVGSGDFKKYAVLGSSAQLIVPIFDQFFEGNNKKKSIEFCKNINIILCIFRLQ